MNIIILSDKSSAVGTVVVRRDPSLDAVFVEQMLALSFAQYLAFLILTQPTTNSSRQIEQMSSVLADGT